MLEIRLHYNFALLHVVANKSLVSKQAVLKIAFHLEGFFITGKIFLLKLISFSAQESAWSFLMFMLHKSRFRMPSGAEKRKQI